MQVAKSAPQGTFDPDATIDSVIDTHAAQRKGKAHLQSFSKTDAFLDQAGFEKMQRSALLTELPLFSKLTGPNQAHPNLDWCLTSGVPHDQKREAILGHVECRSKLSIPSDITRCGEHLEEMRHAQIWTGPHLTFNTPYIAQNVFVFLPKEGSYILATGERLVALDGDARRSRVIDRGDGGQCGNR